MVIQTGLIKRWVVQRGQESSQAGVEVSFEGGRVESPPVTEVFLCEFNGCWGVYPG